MATRKRKSTTKPLTLDDIGKWEHGSPKEGMIIPLSKKDRTLIAGQKNKKRKKRGAALNEKIEKTIKKIDKNIQNKKNLKPVPSHGKKKK